MTPKLIEPGVPGRPTREIPILGEEFLIGRGADCDLRVAEQDISRHHCLIRVRGDEATVVDLGSSNGTFVNGQRVFSQAPLRSADEIRVGRCRFLVDLGDQPEAVWNPMQSEGDPMAVTRKMKAEER